MVKQLKFCGVFLGLFFCLFLPLGGSALASPEDVNFAKSAVDTVNVFCRSEFDHSIHSRYDLMKMSPNYETKLEKLMHTSVGTLYIPDAYEIFAIKSYKIDNVAVHGNKAVATVNYAILAKRTGWKKIKYQGGTGSVEIFEECRKPNYIEKIDLIFDGKRWWVLDPPSPKISIYKIVTFLTNSLGRYEKNNPEAHDGRALPALQDLYDAAKKNVILLKKLIGE